MTRGCSGLLIDLMQRALHDRDLEPPSTLESDRLQGGPMHEATGARERALFESPVTASNSRSFSAHSTGG
jgi:hypothetical protein